MTQRMGIALASLASGLVALYLHLWKLGLAGTLACSVEGRGCEYVQGSQYGWFLGYDVALIGTVGYSILFIAAIISTLGAFEDAKWANTMLQVIIWPAILFTIRLKYYEFFVLKGFCPWCLVSVVAITTCATLALFDRRRINRLEREGTSAESSLQHA
ncbi:MAG: vitamin K epoxide reductase family protein [Gemmatimonas sp.]